MTDEVSSLESIESTQVIATPGTLLPLWEELCAEVWSPLGALPFVPDGLFSDLFREVQRFLVEPMQFRELTEVLSDEGRSRDQLYLLLQTSFQGESSLLRFLEHCYDVCLEIGGGSLAQHYSELVAKFVACHNLRYALRKPFSLSISASGYFDILTQQLVAAGNVDAHVNAMLLDFSEAVHELRAGATPQRVKRCIQVEINLLEALASGNSVVRSAVLSDQAKELKTWPHRALMSSLLNVYGFASDYPGIRHGGNPKSSMRDLGIRDLVSVMVLLTGFVPYLTETIDFGSFEIDDLA